MKKISPLLILWAPLLVLFFFLPGFLSWDNFSEMFLSYSWMGILANGLLLVVLIGDLDLSFMAVTSICQYIMALVLKQWPHIPLVLLFLIPMAVGCLLEWGNMLLIYILKVPAIVVTIGTLNLYYGLLILFSRGRYLYGFPESFTRLSRLGPLPMPALLWGGIVILTLFFLYRTYSGRKILAVGSNPEAARRLGIPVLPVKTLVYGIFGVMAGLAAVVHTLLVRTVAPSGLVGKEFEVVAAVVLGGTVLTTASGSPLGAFGGVITIAVLANAISWLRLPTYWQQVIIGLVILFSVVVYTGRNRRSRRGSLV